MKTAARRLFNSLRAETIENPARVFSEKIDIESYLDRRRRAPLNPTYGLPRLGSGAARGTKMHESKSSSQMVLHRLFDKAAAMLGAAVVANLFDRPLSTSATDRNWRILLNNSMLLWPWVVDGGQAFGLRG